MFNQWRGKDKDKLHLIQEKVKRGFTVGIQVIILDLFLNDSYNIYKTNYSGRKILITRDLRKDERINNFLRK